MTDAPMGELEKMAELYALPAATMARVLLTKMLLKGSPVATRWLPGGYPDNPERVSEVVATGLPGSYPVAATGLPQHQARPLQRAPALTPSDQKDLNPVTLEDVDPRSAEESEANLAPLAFCERIIAHLNQTAGTGYRAKAQKSRAPITARWKEGYQEEDFIRAIDNQWAAWRTAKNGQGEPMVKFMRPETLFGPKFDGYQGAVVKPAAQEDRSSWGELLTAAPPIVETPEEKAEAERFLTEQEIEYADALAKRKREMAYLDRGRDDG